MEPLIQELKEFTQFATSQSAEGDTLDDLFDRWRESHNRGIDRQAVEASLRDMELGETGRPFEEFANEFRIQKGLGPNP